MMPPGKGDIVKSQLLPQGSPNDSYDANPVQPGLSVSDMGTPPQKGGQDNSDVLRLLMELLSGAGTPPQPSGMPPMGAPNGY